MTATFFLSSNSWNTYVCCTIYCKLQSYCSPLRNVTTIKIIATYIQSIIKDNRMKYVPKNHYPNYQYTFHWSTSNDSYGLTHTETELWCGKHPETVEFWLLVKRFGMASGLKLQFFVILRRVQSTLVPHIIFILSWAFIWSTFRSKMFQSTTFSKLISFYTGFCVVLTIVGLIIFCTNTYITRNECQFVCN